MLRRSVFLLLVLGCWAPLQAIDAPPSNAEKPEKPKEPDPKVILRIKEQVYKSIPSEEEKGFERMGVPKRGEYLARVNQAPQTLENYRADATVRPNEQRRTIVLQPLGEMDDQQREIVDLIKEYAEAFFQLPVRVEKPIELKSPGKDVNLVHAGPRDRHGTYERQYEAGKILDAVLSPHVPEDAVLYMGVTADDLWHLDGNVFGLASLDNRAGVCSFHRLLPKFWEKQNAEDRTLLTQRVCRLLSHEAGHAFGLTHCIFYRCAMNGCNGLAEADSSPLQYCPLCERKLLWNIGCDRTKRYEALLEFYRKHGLTKEAEWISARLEK